jgi:hypothetical protein
MILKKAVELIFEGEDMFSLGYAELEVNLSIQIAVFHSKRKGTKLN